MEVSFSHSTIAMICRSPCAKLVAVSSSRRSNAPVLRWRRLRKAAFEGLNFRSSEVFQPVQEREAIRLAEALVKNPSAWMDHINRWVV